MPSLLPRPADGITRGRHTCYTSRALHLTVLGAGYVGLVTGTSLANRHEVTFVERDPERLNSLRAGRAPINEPGVGEALARNRARIGAVADLSAVPSTDLVLVCVGTPVLEAGESDLTQLRSALRALEERPELQISVRSTLPPGISVRLPTMLSRTDGRMLSTNPEFLRQGTAMQDFAQPTRIIFGLYPETDENHLALLKDAYDGIDAPRLVVSVVTADLIKNGANAFLALKLSFVNELAALSEEYGADVDEVLAGIALDPRIGSTYMRPGLGFGGSCLPKELEVLASAGRRHGLAMHIARAAALVNHEQQDRFARRLMRELGPRARRIGMLGLAFKAGTDDLRGSPAVTVARRLVEAGHSVAAFDPAVPAERARAHIEGIEIVESAAVVFDEVDAVVIATDWPEFQAIDLPAVRERMRGNLLYDGRNLLDPTAAIAAGMAYRGIGRRSVGAARFMTEPAENTSVLAGAAHQHGG